MIPGGRYILTALCLAVLPFDFALTQTHKKWRAQEKIYWLCHATELQLETL